MINFDKYTYKKRKIGDYYTPNNKQRISTAFVSDGIKPYETYVDLDIDNDNATKGVVEAYDTIDEAKQGHENWVRRLNNKEIKSLKEINNSKDSKRGSDSKS